MSVVLTNYTLDIRDLSLAKRSAKVEPWNVVYDRDITPEDLILLSSMTLAVADPKAPLARISAPHHALARAVAQGKKDVEISAIYGYAPARMRTLREDPAFVELVSHYEEQELSASASIDEQIMHLALKAKEILLDRMEEDPNSLSTKDLKDLMIAGLDRTGHGPQSSTKIDINDPSRALEAMAAMQETERKGRIISRSEALTVEYTEISDDQTTSRDGPDEGRVHAGRAVGG